jgi:hypothetical protein
MLAQQSWSASTFGIGVALGIVAFAYRCRNRRTERTPPGPPRYPMIGNLLNFPMQGWTEIFSVWHKKYGAHIHEYWY